MTTDDKTYYSLTPDRVELHCSAKDAAAAAASWLEPDGEWHEDTASVEWGILTPVERAAESDKRETPGGEFDYTCTYTLTPVVALINPSIMHTPISAGQFLCEGFPRPLTQADIDALHKRALDAEDHLRREVASNQALIERQTEMERVLSHFRSEASKARKEVDAVTERLRMSRRSMADNLKKHCEVSTAEIADRDATIANLRSIIDKRDKGLACLQEKLQARDQTIADLQGKIANLSAACESREEWLKD